MWNTIKLVIVGQRAEFCVVVVFFFGSKKVFELGVLCVVVLGEDLH